MNQSTLKFILGATGASHAREAGILQTLWSGYGQIVRVQLTGAEMESVILKHVAFPSRSEHPRGWDSELSHQRKVKSYDVEMNWYEKWSSQCHDTCRVPHCYGVSRAGEDRLILLEDLVRAGYPDKKGRLNREEVKVGLRWLAHFHGTFLGHTPEGLWKTGTYWHLETRPHELEVMEDKPLQLGAKAIDERLKKCTYQTFVHGDAKVANFCFSPDGRQAAAVDFQYVGGGCGMKDVAYFLGSSLVEKECREWEEELLSCYFKALHQHLKEHQPQVDSAAVEEEWREVYPWAWADFQRFLVGWMPNHRKLNQYMQNFTDQVLGEL